MNTYSITDNTSLHLPERTLDAMLLCFNLPEAIEEMKQECIWKSGTRSAVTLMKSAFMRIVQIALQSQSEIYFRQSGNVMSIQMLEGKLNFKTDSETIMLKQGSLMTIHEETKHSLIALEKSVFLLTVALCPMNHI
jgi:quercetin dioxygenase-like cupin family protein